MAISAVEKMKITKYLKANGIEYINYAGLCEAIGKKQKIKDEEFLDYFTNIVVDVLSKDESFSQKHMCKIVLVVHSFLGWCHEESVEVLEETLDKIRNFKSLYQDYCARTGTDVDGDLFNYYMSNLDSDVKESYPSANQNENISKYITRISELEKQIQKLERELSEASSLGDFAKEESARKSIVIEQLRRELKELNKNYASKDKEATELFDRVQELQQKITRLADLEISHSDLTQENENLHSSVSELQTEVLNLQQELTTAISENEELKDIREKCTKLTSKVEKLQRLVDKYKEEKKSHYDAESKKFELQKIIYPKLLFGTASIDDLLVEIKTKGIEASAEQIATTIKEMGKVLSFDRSFSKCPAYKIVKPKFIQGETFGINIPTSAKYYDIMLVSDMHICDVNAKVIKGFDILYDYCAKNSIDLILNLGDMFEGNRHIPESYERVTENYKNIQDAISNLPYAPGIYHALLGGNHEKGIAKAGYDPVSMLVDNRNEFINLGYSQATINLNQDDQTIDSFDVHHPDDFCLAIDINAEDFTLTKVAEYLKEMYAAQGRNQADSYIDIFGHYHTSRFDFANGYYYLPSYFCEENRKGACHVRAYLDEEKGISYMLFMPLTYNLNTKLSKTTEIVYQRILKK